MVTKRQALLVKKTTIVCLPPKTLASPPEALIQLHSDKVVLTIELRNE